MNCLERNQHYRSRHGFGLASDAPGSCVVCAGCGKPMFAKIVSGQWGWYHGEQLTLEDEDYVVAQLVLH